MNTTNNQLYNKMKTKEALTKAQELILYMDNMEQVFNSYKEPWIKNYAKKVRKGIFNIEDGIKGMKYLMKNVQNAYNKELGTDKDGKIPDVFIYIHNDEKRIIQIELLKSVLSDVYDNKEDLEGETLKLIKSLEGYF